MYGPGFGFGLGRHRRIGGGAPGLSIVKSANLAFDWNPATLGLSDGATLTDWPDAVAGLGGTIPLAAPTFVANSLNGIPGVRFAGGQYIDLGRPAALTNTIDAGDYTIMIVCTNLVAGANSIASPFGSGTSGGGLWFVCNLTQYGRYSSGTLANTLAADDLYVLFYTGRSSSFTRAMSGMNGTCFNPQQTAYNSGSGSWGIGTGLHDTTTHGNSYSFRGDILRVMVWNTNLSFSNVILQTRKHFEYCSKPVPWASANKYLLSDGDSILSIGAGGITQNYPYLMAQNLGLPLGTWSNLSRPSAQMVDLVGDFEFQFSGLSAALGIPTVHNILEYGNMRGDPSLYTWTDLYFSTAKALDPTTTIVFLNSTAHGGVPSGSGGGDQTSLGGPPSSEGLFRIAHAAHYQLPYPNMDALVDLFSDPNIGAIGANPYSGTWPTTDFYDTSHLVGAAGQDPAHGHARLAAMAAAVNGPLLA